jgi:hypothetical protein
MHDGLAHARPDIDSVDSHFCPSPELPGSILRGQNAPTFSALPQICWPGCRRGAFSAFEGLDELNSLNRHLKKRKKLLFVSESVILMDQLLQEFE